MTNESVYFQLRRPKHIRQWKTAEQTVARSRDVDPDDLSRPDVFEELAEAHSLARLSGDNRIQEAKQVVAKDHNVDPSEVSLADLLKITAGAYCGYQQTSDWEVPVDA